MQGSQSRTSDAAYPSHPIPVPPVGRARKVPQTNRAQGLANVLERCVTGLSTEDGWCRQFAKRMVKATPMRTEHDSKRPVTTMALGDPAFVSANTDLIVMLSGSLGSTAALWKVISSCSIAPHVVFFEGDKPASDATRRKAIEKIMASATCNDGGPLTMPGAGARTCLSVLGRRSDESFPEDRASELVLMCLRAASHVKQLSAGDRRPWACTIVVGNGAGPYQALLAQLEFGCGVNVRFPYRDETQALIALAECRVVSAHNSTSSGRSVSGSCGAAIPQAAFQLLTSCNSGRDPPAMMGYPFPAMCQACGDCSTWCEAWIEACTVCPPIHLGLPDFRSWRFAEDLVETPGKMAPKTQRSRRGGRRTAQGDGSVCSEVSDLGSEVDPLEECPPAPRPGGRARGSYRRAGSRQGHCQDPDARDIMHAASPGTPHLPHADEDEYDEDDEEVVEAEDEDGDAERDDEDEDEEGEEGYDLEESDPEDSIDIGEDIPDAIMDVECGASDDDNFTEESGKRRRNAKRSRPVTRR